MGILNKEPHPGLVLQEKINSMHMSRSELAARTGVTEKHISTVINGNKGISPAFAKKLAYAFDEQASVWLNLQAKYDAYCAEIEAENNVSDEEKNILHSLKDVIEYFLEQGIMHNHCGDTEKVLQLRKILCVSNLASVPKITYNAAYRAQIKSNTAVNPFVLFAWQRMCELETKNIETEGNVSKEKLEAAVPEIKKILLLSDTHKMLKLLQGKFAECGIALKIVHNFPGAPVQGFIKESWDDGQTILCLTLRRKRMDTLIFTLFHEIAHVLNGDLSVRFVDFTDEKSEMEKNADERARNMLIDPELYRKFVLSRSNYTTESGIEQFAKTAGVRPSVVVGRLQNDGWLEWSQFNKYIEKIECFDL